MLDKIFGYIIGSMCLGVAIILMFDLLPITSERHIFACIFILLGNLFFKRKVGD